MCGLSKVPLCHPSLGFTPSQHRMHRDTELKLLSQVEAVGIDFHRVASDSLINLLAVSSREFFCVCGCWPPPLGLHSLLCTAVLLSITSFFALSSACPLMSVLEVLISLADQIIPDVHSSSLFLAENLSPGS